MSKPIEIKGFYATPKIKFNFIEDDGCNTQRVSLQIVQRFNYINPIQQQLKTKRMKSFVLVLLLFALKMPVLTAQEDKNIPGHWMYCNGTSFIYLTLDSDSTFHFHYQSKSANLDLNGGYSLMGTELMLISPKKTETFIVRDMKIGITPALKSVYPDFQPLEPTRKANLKDAYKECGILRMQLKKANRK